jgi:hypothetical protein
MCYGGLMVSGRKQLQWKTGSVNNFIMNVNVYSELSTNRWSFFLIFDKCSVVMCKQFWDKVICKGFMGYSHVMILMGRKNHKCV